LSKKYRFDGDAVYRGTATFKTSNEGSDTFSTYVYYHLACFNPIRHAHGVNSDNVTFVVGDDNIASIIKSDVAYNNLYDDMASGLQHKYLNNMTEKKKHNQIFESDTLPGNEILKIVNAGPKKSSCTLHILLDWWLAELIWQDM